MSSHHHRIPSYRLHRPTGQAVVRLDGRDHYLGRHDTPTSREAYDRLIAEWLTARSSRPSPRPAQVGGPAVTVNDLILAYWKHCQQHYRSADGQPTGELENVRLALRPLRQLYGTTPAAAFGPLALRAVQDAQVRSGLARTTANARLHKARRLFRWAAGMELIPAAVYQALLTVDGLRRGRTAAPEPPPVAAVPREHVAATLPLLPGPVAAMVRFQLLTGCRAGEVMGLRGCDLDVSGPVWVFRPRRHKNEHRGHDRVVFVGPLARQALLPYLRVTCPRCGKTDRPARLRWRSGLCGPCGDRLDRAGVCGPWPLLPSLDDYFLFSPREHVEDLRAERAARRRSKRTPSEVAKKRKASPRRRPGERYNRRSYRQAVVRACRLADVPPWTPLRLRHTAATEIRARYGVEAARVVLGHTRVETSQIYAERDLGLAARIMGDVG